MRGGGLKIRLAATCIYAVLAFFILRWFYWGDSFCDEPRFQGSLLPVLRFSTVIAALYLFGTFVAGPLKQLTKGDRQLIWASPLLSALVVSLGVFSLPMGLYRGYGRFLLEGTPADMSCLFREGYGMVAVILFPFVFGVLTLISELILLRFSNRIE